jgi:class 3 adenylate cyclase
MPETSPKRSPEIEAVIGRVLDSFSAGDSDVMVRIASPGPEFLSIGTDPTEWWDAETFLPVVKAQFEELAGVRYEVHHIEGWELDRVGWAATRVRVMFGDAETEMRITAVLVLDAGQWRIVQWHASEGVPNEESLGFSLTTTLSEILDSIDIEQDLDGIGTEGMVTLMFTDVEGSTGHVRELGDRRFTELMDEHLTLVSDVAERGGGQVIKSVGDGALLVFSSARSAITGAVEIQRATADADVPYRIRIGVHAGDVVRTDTDVMGFAVNKAARVASAADGGQVVVSSVVKELVGFDPGFTFGEPFHAELRGIDGSHELVPVLWESVQSDA